MATSTFTAAATNSSDTSFRTWGGGISAALAAVGFVKTADTGQINWATVLTPASSSTYQGYEVWRLNDSLQSTAPLFLKLEYGSGTTASFPALRVTVGKASSGAGAITGTTVGSTTFLASTGTTSTATTWYVTSGDDGSVLMIAGCPQVVDPNVGMLFGLERCRTTAGAATPTGGVVWARAGAASAVATCSAFNYANNGTVHAASQTSAPGGATLTTLAVGGVAPMFACTATDGLGSIWQPRSMLTYMNIDCATVVPVTVPGFGTYLPLGVGFASSAGTYNWRHAMVWS